MSGAPVHVVYPHPGGEGYLCILHMARLAAKLLDGELVIIQPGTPSLTDKLSAVLFPRKRAAGSCLLICPAPADLSRILLVPHWRHSYRRIVAWVFDSFWTQWIPPSIRTSRIFDHVFVAEMEDLSTWRETLRAPIDWLPWGSDVLHLGSPNPLRQFDLLRFGRQPKNWDDDSANMRACESFGLSFHGRPQSLSDATDNERGLMKVLSKSKFALAFSNRVNPTMQTHPQREYITGRWTDALASGATVAGIPPRSDSVRALLWPEALLDLGTVDQAEGLTLIASAVREWAPGRAQLNYLKALETFDWRWRLKTLAEALQIHAPKLEAELSLLKRTSHSVQPASIAH